MTMKILIVEDEPVLSRLYNEMFRRMMPEARVDIVVSVGGYLKVADISYDAYVLDETIAEGKSAFKEIAPRIQQRFPNAFILHNSSFSDQDSVSRAERLNKIKFARDPHGRVITCNKKAGIIIEVLRTMVISSEDAKPRFSQRESMPVCQRPLAPRQPQQEFRQPLTCCRY